LKEGARVAVTGRNPATFEAARAALGSDVLMIPVDASDVAAQKQVAETVRDAFGALEILFVNAGIAALKPLEQWDEDAFDRTFAINLKGPFFLIQALLPVFANPASIVLNGSVNAHIGMPNTSVYGASKAALISFTRTLSGELISRGIRVNAVSPGPASSGSPRGTCNRSPSRSRAWCRRSASEPPARLQARSSSSRPMNRRSRSAANC
jgi:NAD(P)-dependent dehydrogenase (short-subunit alcohol dehydrogenase family)